MLKEVTATLCGLVLAASVGCGRNGPTQEELELALEKANYALKLSEEVMPKLEQETKKLEELKQNQIYGPKTTIQGEELFNRRVGDIDVKFTTYTVMSAKGKDVAYKSRLDLIFEEDQKVMVFFDEAYEDFLAERIHIYTLPDMELFRKIEDKKEFEDLHEQYMNMLLYIFHEYLGENNPEELHKLYQKNEGTHTSLKSPTRSLIQFVSNNEPKQQAQPQKIKTTSTELYNNYIPSMQAHVQFFKVVMTDFENSRLLTTYSMLISRGEQQHLISDVKRGNENIIDKYEIIDKNGRRVCKTMKEVLAGQLMYDEAKFEMLSPYIDKMYKENPPIPVPPRVSPWQPSPSPTPKPGPSKQEEKKKLKGVHTSYSTFSS